LAYKPILHTVYFLARNPTLKNLRYLQSIEHRSPQKLQRLQEEKLAQLLLHAYENVPYYHDILKEARVIDNNEALLENFEKVPVLTKQIIRQQGDKLYSKDYRTRKWYFNTSGGSTGEPVKFIQDKYYKAWGMACQYYFYRMCGGDMGEPIVKLWGSQRDVFKGSEKITTQIQRYLSNVTLLNSFKMSQEDMQRYASLWNKARPKLVHAYTSSILEFARFIERSGRKVFRPASILCTAETLTEDVRGFAEKIFGCPVLNQYGSREVGIIACECPKKEGMHTFPVNNKIEILDDNLEPCKPADTGGIYITNLNNYSMPLIRYNIGDTGKIGEKQRCSCGRGWPLIGSVTGRQSDHFRTRAGKLVHGEYFTHLFYMKKGIRKFQVIQKDFDLITIKLVVTDPKELNKSKELLIHSIRKVMGADCKVEFKFVEEIPPTPSGKYIYTICNVK